MDDFQLTLNLAAPPERVYRAIALPDGPGRWWTTFAEVESQIGGRAHFPFPGAGFHATFEIEELEEPRLITWRCVDSSHPESSGWSDLTEWKGTSVRFEIEPSDDGCRLTFTHVGLIPRLECNETCRTTWHFYLGESLRGLVENGQGKPYTGKSSD